MNHGLKLYQQVAIALENAAFDDVSNQENTMKVCFQVCLMV